MDIKNFGISGISGRFPRCSNVEEFKEALFSGRQLINFNHGRWDAKLYKTPSALGAIEDWHLFDPAFFGISPLQAQKKDPRSRLMLEAVFESIVDAGVNPNDLRGRKIGVFVAITQNASNTPDLFNRSVSLIANSVSYFFDFRGPNYSMDTACATGIYGVNQALNSLRLGECEAAVVVGAQAHFLPHESTEFNSIGVLSPDGVGRTFDSKRRGYVKAEGIASIFIQKIEDAKRIYAVVQGVSSNLDGYKEEGPMHPSSESQHAMLKTAYENYQIDPKEVCYVEAHGTGTIVGDVQECRAIVDFFFDKRQEPLLIGSSKPVTGHAETAAGLVSIIKVLIVMHSNTIPGNRNFTDPAIEIPGLFDNKLKVVATHTPYPGGLAGISSFGFGGSNSHIVLKPFRSQPIQYQPGCRLVAVSGRTQNAVEELLEAIIKNQTSMEYLTLINDIFKHPIENHPYRGYVVLGDNPVKEIQIIQRKKRPIWFCYSGMGSQWPGMAKDLMQIKLFRETIKRCCEVLKPFGMDLENIILNGTKETFENCANCFPAITAMSIALTELLKSYGVEPDGFVGHSMGEVGCAYADGLLTIEQAVLAAYGRGYAILNSKIEPGLMAAVGMSLEECMEILPEDVEICCDNCDDNITIGGLPDNVKRFMEKLSALGIFAKEVETGKMAFHSSYIKKGAPLLLSFLKKYIPETKERSSKWISSSVLEKDWNTDLAKYHSAEYHVNNYSSRVLLKQALKKIPKDAIVIEVAPKGLLQAILKRSLDASVTKLHLIDHQSQDNLKFFLSTIGKLYNCGIPIKLEVFCKESYPFGLEAPMIASSIKWDHSTSWPTIKLEPDSGHGRQFEVDFSKEENSYLLDHVIGGKSIFPATGFLYYIWKYFADIHGKDHEEFPVIIENFNVLKSTMIDNTSVIKFEISMFSSSGEFEITRDEEVLASGIIKQNKGAKFLNYSENCSSDSLPLSPEDYYMYNNLRGIGHKGTFQIVTKADLLAKSNEISWTKNWIIFMDAIVLSLITFEHKGLSIPTGISKVVIDPTIHRDFMEGKTLQLYYNEYMKSGKCGGVELQKVMTKKVEEQEVLQRPTLCKYQFVSNVIEYDPNEVQEKAFRQTMQIIIDNNLASSIVNVSEFVTSGNEKYMKLVQSTVLTRYVKNIKYSSIEKITPNSLNNLNLLIVDDFQEVFKEFTNSLKNTSNNPFILTTKFNLPLKEHNLAVIAEISSSQTSYKLLRLIPAKPSKTLVIKMDQDFEWLEILKSKAGQFQEDESRIYLVSQEDVSGIVGFFKSLKEEYSFPNVRIFWMKSDCPEEFAIDNKFFEKQIVKDLAVNVLHQNKWGTYCLLPIKDKHIVPTKNVKVERKGNNLHWIQASSFEPKNTVKISFGNINLGSNSRIGIYQYCGITNNGIKVLGVAPEEVTLTHIKPHPAFSWNLPTNSNLHELVSTPLPYILAFYIMKIKTKFDHSARILVLNGRNINNLAAICLAKIYEFHLLVTVKDNNEKSFLEEQIPSLNSDNIIITSEDVSLEETIMKKTAGKGVNIIIRSDNSDNISFANCLSKNGEVYNLNFEGEKAINYISHNVNSKTIFEEDYEKLLLIKIEMQDLYSKKKIKPLPYEIFQYEELKTVSSGFEYSAKVIEFPRDGYPVDAEARTYFNPDKVYVIIGGLGGFGLEVAKWLVTKGAKKMVLNGRSAISNGYQKLYLNEWKKMGVQVIVTHSDSSTLKGAEALIETSLQLGEIGGIFNSALVLKDKLIPQLEKTDFKEVLAAKVMIASNLDAISRQRCLNLDHFVVFSSMVSSVGHAGQSNYSYANAAMEGIIENRRKDNLPGLAVQWGPIASVGYFTRTINQKVVLNAIPQELKSCLQCLDFFMVQDNPVVSTAVYQFGDLAQDNSSNKPKTTLETILGLFGISELNGVDRNVPLVNMGMDSILGYEIKNILKKNFKIDYSIGEIRNLTLEDFIKIEEANKS